jgi:hypothetical protein
MVSDLVGRFSTASQRDPARQAPARITAARIETATLIATVGLRPPGAAADRHHRGPGWIAGAAAGPASLPWGT